MAKNLGESRIPLPRTVRPSLLPKIRSLGPSKIGSIGHRRSPSYCSAATLNNKQQQQQQQQQFVVGKTASSGFHSDVPEKQPKIELSSESSKDNLLETDYSISPIWNVTADNKEAEHLMRLNDEKLALFCSQEDLSDSYACMKKQESREDMSNNSETGHKNNNNNNNNNNSNNSNSNHNNPSGAVGEYAIESPVATAPHYLMLTKQNSFEHDESLGILTPDQMTDFTVALESSRSPSCENLPGHTASGEFLGSKNISLASAASRHLDIAACLPSIEALIPANDRSPSLEELPLDPKPVVIVDEAVGILEATLTSEKSIESPEHQPSRSADLSPKKVAIDSTETSENTSEPTRCSVSSHILPTSFITSVTSVTSITSLEAGYQGDGENSRPASRGAEPLSIAPIASLIVSAACSRQDPMTDSDFFTESDADAHEEIVRGDRRAQVIDGTLFCAPNERRCPSFEPGEEMDSSGIYSDLDKRQDSVGLDAEGCGDGDHTTDTGDTGDTEISMKSQASPRDKTPVPAITTKNVLTPQPSVLNDTVESTSSMAEMTVIKCQKNEQNSATKSKSCSVSNKENSVPLKKYKMPKRNVISKIKTMIESNQKIVKEETENDTRRPQRQQRKNGRWDAVMNKIEANKQRSRPSKKEVKSRVLQNLGTSTSFTASTSSTRRTTGDSNNIANIKDKRRMRGRTDANSTSQETARSSVRSSASDLSSANSKEILKRPLRKNCVDAQLPPNNHQVNTNLSKSNLTTSRKSPSIQSVQSNVNSKQKNTTTGKVADRNNASNNRPSPVSSAAGTTTAKDPQTAVLNNQVVFNHHSHINHINHNNNNSSSNNNNNNNNNSSISSSSSGSNASNHHNRNGAVPNAVVPNGVASSNSVMEATPTTGGSSSNAVHAQKETKDQECQVDLLQEAFHEVSDRQKELETAAGNKRADGTVQALAITVQYFAHRLENNVGSRLKKDFEKMKNEWLATKAELEDLKLRNASVEDALNQEREENQRTLESLRDELEQEQSERLCLEQSLFEERKLLKSVEERERERRAAIEFELAQVHQQQAQSQQQQQQQNVTPDQAAMVAEVESLRTVLDLRLQESAQLRSEVDLLRRELEEKEVLRQKYEALEARCEDLQAQLQSKEAFERQLSNEHEVLMGSIHQLSKQNKRLSQRNEELTWRLRQKNEVVSVLTNQLTPQSQRLSKSLGPDHSDHSTADLSCSQKSEQQSCSSIVRYLVEKGDSVSWTLDITESLETSSNESCNKSPGPAARRYRETNRSAVSRQNPLRLSMPRRTNNSVASKTRSNSICTMTEPANATTAAVSSAVAVRTATSNDESVWSPSYSSTPMQRRRNIPAAETSWSLSNTITETSSSCNSGGVNNTSTGGSNNSGVNAINSSSKSLAVELSTTDEDEEEEVGQRPQEAGGEAMISEETSASSSSSEDESSVSSGDIP